jgi:hypothetical protein
VKKLAKKKKKKFKYKGAEHFIKKDLKERGHNADCVAYSTLTKRHRYLPTVFTEVHDGTTDKEVKQVINSALRFCKSRNWENECEIIIQRKDDYD